jgi:adenylosuccinate synthase
LQEVLSYKNRLLELLGGKPLGLMDLYDEYVLYAQQLKPFVEDVEEQLSNAIHADENVLFEGAQGAMLDLDQGTYPFVTSSHPITAGACIGTGLSPNKATNVMGVCVAYATRVGSGPFPTELSDDTGERIRQAGNEFGTTTGRPRRCGWLDLVALRQSCRMNGFTSLAVTRLDVLTGFDNVKLCTEYELDGSRLRWLPSDAKNLQRVEPVYETMAGWREDLTTCRTLSDLPIEAREFLERISEYTGVPISIVSVGPDREQTIFARLDLLWQTKEPASR